MTATQEINKWRQDFSQLNTDAEREAFKEKMYASLAKKDEKGLTEGLLALKETAHKIRVEAENKIKKKKAASIQVFPASEKDIEMLEALLMRLDIPFRISL